MSARGGGAAGHGQSQQVADLDDQKPHRGFDHVFGVLDLHAHPVEGDGGLDQPVDQVRDLAAHGLRDVTGEGEVSFPVPGGADLVGALLLPVDPLHELVRGHDTGVGEPETTRFVAFRPVHTNNPADVRFGPIRDNKTVESHYVAIVLCCSPES